MSDKLPIGASETGTYRASGPRVDLSGTAINFGTVFPSRTFAGAAGDSSVDFDTTDTCQVWVIKISDNAVWAIYSGVPWTDASPDTLDLSSGDLEASEGTLSDADSVNVWAMVPFGRHMPDAEGVDQGTPPQVDAAGEWTV